MRDFHKKQWQWEQRQCHVCHETWPTQVGLTNCMYICARCKRDRQIPKLLSRENDMDPDVVPECLEDLTQIEQMLIARASPIMTVYRRKGGQRGYRNHVLNFPQDIQGFLNLLPPNVHDLPFLVIRKVGIDNSYKDFRVCRKKSLQL